jgi:hypothetical protein
MVYCLFDIFWLNLHDAASVAQLVIPLLIYSFLNIFNRTLCNIISKIEQIETPNGGDTRLFEFHLPQVTSNDSKTFKYHHMLFCSSIVFFIASKTMAAKFISIGFLTINVGGIVFSLAYLAPVSILLIYFLKVKEKVDIYDELSNLNPFRIDTNYKVSVNKFAENYIKPKERKDG